MCLVACPGGMQMLWQRLHPRRPHTENTLLKSDQHDDGVQDVLNNLMIAAIEFRSDDDPDIRPYVHDRCVDMRIVEPSPEITASRASLLEALRAVIGRLIGIKVAGRCTSRPLGLELNQIHRRRSQPTNMLIMHPM